MSERQIFIFDHDWQSGNIKKLIIVTATIINFVIHINTPHCVGQGTERGRRKF